MPVIATNWSGPSEFLREDNSYPLPATTEPIDEKGDEKDEKVEKWAKVSGLVTVCALFLFFSLDPFLHFLLN